MYADEKFIFGIERHGQTPAIAAVAWMERSLRSAIQVSPAMSRRSQQTGRRPRRPFAVSLCKGAQIRVNAAANLTILYPPPHGGGGSGLGSAGGTMLPCYTGEQQM